MPVTYSEVDALEDPLDSSRFQFNFSQIPGSSIDSYKLTTMHAVGQLPDESIEQLPVYMPGGQKRSFRGGYSTDSTWSLTFIEDHSGTVSKSFDSWLKKVRDKKTTKSSNKAEYAKDVEFVFYKSTAEEAFKYLIKNAFPLTVSKPSMSETSAQSEINVTFSHDGIYLQGSY